MKYAESQGRANRKYRSKTYDQVNITVYKGLRDRWKAVAEQAGLSLAGFITAAVEAHIAAQYPDLLPFERDQSEQASG